MTDPERYERHFAELDEQDLWDDIVASWWDDEKLEVGLRMEQQFEADRIAQLRMEQQFEADRIAEHRHNRRVKIQKAAGTVVSVAAGLMAMRYLQVLPEMDGIWTWPKR